MTSPTLAERRDAAVQHGLREAERAAGEPLGSALDGGPSPTASVHLGRAHVAYVAWDDAGQQRLRREAARLELAAASGVPVPDLRAADPGGAWLLVERVRSDPPSGPDYVAAAVRAAAAVAALPVDALRGQAPAAQARRASRRDLPARLLRLAAGPVPTRAFLRLRAAAAALPATVVVHGDFHPGNVLSDGDRGTVHVVDLELMALGPAGLDLCQLWCGVDVDDRPQVLAALRALPTARPDVLLPWVALRTLADVTVALPRDAREPALVAHGVQAWRQAQTLASSGALAPLGGPAWP